MLYMLRNRSSSLLTTKTKGSQVSDAYAVEQAQMAVYFGQSFYEKITSALGAIN